jgi:hypothetical protein
MRRGSFCPLLRCRLNRSTQHRRQISLLGFQIARSRVAVRLADEPLCSDRLAVGHWCSRSTRAATGFADRKNIRRFWSPTLCPQSRTLHWSDGNEEVSITPPSNCALQLQASFWSVFGRRIWRLPDQIADSLWQIFEIFLFSGDGEGKPG